MTTEHQQYYGYTKEIEMQRWRKVDLQSYGKKINCWYNPRTNASCWQVDEPLPTRHHIWKSSAEFATNVKPIAMKTCATTTENVPSQFKR